MIVGNHEFDFGFPLLRSVEEQAQFPFLAANIVLASTGKPAFTPYARVEFGGVSVAIVGLTTSALPRIADPGAMEGLRVLDAVESAKALIPRLREKEKVDIVIVALHGGLGKAPCSPGEENQALALAEGVPGIDLILSGHTHQPLSLRHKGVPILQAHAHGRALAVAEFLLKKEKNRWMVQGCETHLVQPAPETQTDAKVLELTATLRAATDTYLNTFATNLAVDLDGRWSRMEDTALLQLLHDAMRSATHAQLTASASPGSRLFVPKGPTSVRQFFALMPYENKVARIRITGAQLKAYLEHSARFYNFCHLPELYSREMAGFDFDCVDGVTYALDISKPVGSRVVRLQYQGQPVRGEQEFTLAVTSYRLSGGGGYMDAIGFKGKPEMIHPVSLRNLLLEQVLSKPLLNVQLSNNWFIIPALDRERVMAQQPN
jgi:2',3'-cyclic-nucleotide 2'-phosphodiesterase/3'-nucleotidase